MISHNLKKNDKILKSVVQTDLKLENGLVVINKIKDLKRHCYRIIKKLS